jgi:hypothetical protein
LSAVLTAPAAPMLVDIGLSAFLEGLGLLDWLRGFFLRAGGPLFVDESTPARTFSRGALRAT